METSKTQNETAACGGGVAPAAARECANATETIHAADTTLNNTAIPTKKPTRLLLKISEAAEMLGISTASIRRLIVRGELAVNRKLRHVLIPRSELERFATGGDR